MRKVFGKDGRTRDVPVPVRPPAAPVRPNAPTKKPAAYDHAAGVATDRFGVEIPQEIREAFLSMAYEHRECLEDLVATIAGKRLKLPHKLGIRCRLLPHQRILHGILAK